MMSDPVTLSALCYVARGWPLVRIPFGQKAPRDRDWQKNAISTADAAERHLCGQMNIGVLLGTASGGLVDVDLDCPEACAVADKILPPTAAVFGRASKPRSHWLYYVGGPAPSLKFSDPLTGEVLLELRGDKRDGSTGYQTVFPPSIHPSGEPIEWVEEGELARVAYAELKEAVTYLAIRCLITRYCPGASSANEAWAALNRIDPRLGNEICRWLGNSAQKATAPGSGEAVAALRPDNGSANGSPLPAAANIFQRVRRLVPLTAAVVNGYYDPPCWSEAEEARLRSALAVLPADYRDDWLHRGMELHSLGWGERGYALWAEWSRKCPEKFDEADQRKTWEGFDRRDPATPRRMIASLFHAAIERGWRDAQPSLDAQEPRQPASVTASSLKVFRADELLSAAAPRRRWRVDRWIPQAEVTLFAGDGGIGKSTLALQLCVACVAGGDCVGLKAEESNALYVSAEDQRDEIHWRLEQINKHAHISIDKLAGLNIVDLAGTDAVLATFEKDGRIKPTPLFREIERAAADHKAGLVIFDAVADIFGGNENERAEVRAFIGLLRGLAMRLDAAILLIAHPSVDGIKTNRGYSGSTHWNNAVRSRLYFTDAPAEPDGSPRGLDIRMLELAKSNRARRGEQIRMMWSEGGFVPLAPGAPSNPTNDQHAEQIFLQMLRKFTHEGQHVSHLKSPTYAPTQFTERSPGKELGQAPLGRAMNRLLEKGVICVKTEGPPSRRRSHLAVVEKLSGATARSPTVGQPPVEGGAAGPPGRGDLPTGRGGMGG